MSLNPEADYPDAATRGILRKWKQALARDYLPIKQACTNRAAGKLAQDFARRGSVVGRHRALAKLTKILGPGARPDVQDLESNTPYALWYTLSPETTRLDKTDQPRVGIWVRFVFAGSGYRHLMTGPWSLFLPDHAMGRAISRSAGADPSEIVRAAHEHVLRLRIDAVVRKGVINTEKSFIVRAGPGGFICTLQQKSFAPTKTLVGTEVIFVRAHTWIADEMLYDGQAVLIPDGEPGEQFGDQWLQPLPLRLRRPLRKPQVGSIRPADLRRPLSLDEAEAVVHSAARSEVICAEYADGEKSIIKGKEIVEEAAKGNQNRSVSFMQVLVNNTTQLELLLAAMEILEEGELTQESLATFVEAQAIAAGVPGGLHDDTLFNAAMERHIGNPTGTA